MAEPYERLNDLLRSHDLLPITVIKECRVCRIMVLCMWDEEPLCDDHSDTPGMQDGPPLTCDDEEL